jgi:hypothetical protein
LELDRGGGSYLAFVCDIANSWFAKRREIEVYIDILSSVNNAGQDGLDKDDIVWIEEQHALCHCEHLLYKEVQSFYSQSFS